MVFAEIVNEQRKEGRKEYVDGCIQGCIRQRTETAQRTVVKHKWKQLGWHQIMKTGNFSLDPKGDRESL